MNTNLKTSVPLVEIMLGIPPAQRRQTAEIYYTAFRHKLTPILGAPVEQAIDMLNVSMHPENAFVALGDGRVLGVVGFHHAGKQLVDIRRKTVFEAHGFVSGAWRMFIRALLTRKPEPGELLLDGIAVHADARGQGIGTQLIQAVSAFADQHGYTKVHLEVVNSNPRARQLYERMGFIPTKTLTLPFLKPLGFTAVTTMVMPR